jgi:hypothetical protein
MVNCHCRDCQLAGGSGYAATLIMSALAVRVIQGKPRRFEKAADSGNVAIRQFCESCGSPLFASSTGHPDYLGVRAASLDDPAWFKSEADVWVASAQSWDCMDAAIPKFQKNRSR